MSEGANRVAMPVTPKAAPISVRVGGVMRAQIHWFNTVMNTAASVTFGWLELIPHQQPGA